MKDSFFDSDEENESPMLKVPSMNEKKLTVSLAERDMAAHLYSAQKQKALYDSSVILKKKLVYYDEEGFIHLFMNIIFFIFFFADDDDTISIFIYLFLYYNFYFEILFYKT